MRALGEILDFELFKSAMSVVADEMAVSIFRTAYSGVLKSGMDYSTAYADRSGRVVAQGLTQPSHLGSIPTALKTVVRRFGATARPGDVYIMNDPYDGGMHLPDIFVFQPTFVGDEVIGYACTICHHSDVGGRVAGSNAADSTEIFQEGVRIPPLKLYDAGRPNDTLLVLLRANVRMPVKLMGDLRAQLAACTCAERRVHELVDRYGKDRFLSFMVAINDYAERTSRAAIGALPDARASFEDWIDDDGIDDEPIRLFVTIEKTGDRFRVDWTGTSPQVRGALNSTLSFTKAASYTAIKSILPDALPNAEGAFDPIEVIAPLGTVVHGRMPAACAARGLTGFRTVDCCFGALAQMYPDRVYAASDGGNTGVSVGGYTVNGDPFVYVDFFCSAWGGGPWGDGLDGAANVFANISAHSVEEIELEHPLRLRRFEYLPGSGGAGRHRGGLGVVREYEFLEDEATLQIRADRVHVPPYGLAGGCPGRPARNTMVRDGRELPLPGKVTTRIRKGDVFRIETAGGGGWGAPDERDPARIAEDTRDGKAGHPDSVAAE